MLYNPGSLVRARGREWVVEASTDEILELRPLGGSTEDTQTIIPALEISPVEEASFPYPDIDKPGPFYSALLLRDALLMKCRAGAGPFRSFGGITVEPRAYQLVPLLMALKQKTVRLLIADDVGVGKTIEAALIVREMLDRGEVERFAVLCPPHLVEQWLAELRTRFHIQAVGLTASSVNRLERNTPRGLSIFEYYEAVVISLDYIKNDSHRAYFMANPPELILVDEAHTCTALGSGRQLRYDLLKELCKDHSRHLIMLTATPHSGNEAGFFNLLSLLRPDFAELAPGAGGTVDKAKLRQELSAYFVQRRRVDIDEWHDTALFPRRKTKEETYKLSGSWESFFEKVRVYCVDLAQRAEKEKGQQASVMWYAVFALLRCVSSSPDAARRALTTRLRGSADEIMVLADEERISDGMGEELVSNDEEPPAALEEKAETELLADLIEKTDSLRGIKADPKLACLVQQVEALINEKPRFKPVIFCRYIATAHYVAEQLRDYFNHKRDDASAARDVQIACVTGELTSDEREEQIEKLLEEADLPILVATDCLSEGINLQHGFDAVIHYDLAWNPTRHEQREGRVDRFGQKSGEVRCVMLYGENNPVDGLIFKVILKKAQIIKQELGILVPIPEDERKIQTALVKAAIMKSASGSSARQGALDFGDSDIESISDQWQDALDKALKNRSVFAQRRLKPEDVLPEWEKQSKILGEDKDVEEFVKNSLQILPAPLDEVKNRSDSWRFTPEYLPPALRRRMESEGYAKPLRIGFHYPPDKGSIFIHRSHPIVSILADHILENALEEKNFAGETAGSSRDDSSRLVKRCGVFESASVNQVTTIFLIRLRHQIEIIRNKRTKSIVAEEALLLGCEGRSTVKLFGPDNKAVIEKLLKEQPSGNLNQTVIERELKISMDWFLRNNEWFEGIAKERAEVLRADHRRVREASEDTGTFTVSPSLPVDLIGLYVLLPTGL